MLTPYLPYPLVSGGQIRTYNLLKNLSKKHDITLFCLIKDEKETDYLQYLQPFCKKIQVFKRTFSPWALKNIINAAITSYPFVVTRNWVKEMKPAVARELESEHYDLIHAETFYMMPNIPETSIPVILVEQTIEYLGYQSYASKNRNPLLKPLFFIDINKIKYWEKYYWRNCNCLITMSEDDKKFIQSIDPEVKNIYVVANGVDIDWFDKVQKKLPQNPTILFVGTFKWLPNIEAVDYLVNQVWPLIKRQVPQARLHIVGNSPTAKALSYQQKDASITISGSVPDIRQAYAGAHILLAPVFSGKGTRFKILEAMATGTPAIGTSIALEGFGITPGRQAIVADDAAEMASAVQKVLTNTGMRRKLSDNGKKFVSRYFDWKSISESLDSIYQKVGRR